MRGNSDAEASSTFQPLVRYPDEEVDGRPQESSQIRFMTVGGSEAGARAVACRYLVGEQATVDHHPKLHYLAVLEPGRFVEALLPAIVPDTVFVLVALT